MTPSPQDCHGNPGRVPKPSRDAPLPAEPAGSARDCHGNPGRVPKPSRDAPLPAEPAGSARDCHGNPGRVPKPSRDAPLPAEPAGSARDEEASSGAVRTAVGGARRFYGNYAPWISLGLGIVARALSRKGVDFAPKAVAIVALTWLVPIAVTRWLEVPGPGQREGKLRRLLRTASPTVTVLLYKNVLFFLVPIWFGSAHWTSLNMIVPVLLAAMALFTCFARPYRERVLERPRARVLWTAAVLFAALVPASAVMLRTSPRTSIILAAVLASLVAWVALAPSDRLLSKRGALSALAVAVPVAALLGWAAPLFPPVPLVCYDRGAGIAVVNRELEGRATSFPLGTAKVYAWFAVTLPKRHQEEIAFQWYRDGKPVGGRFRTKVAGGRKEGYRTWTMHTAPGVGDWRVDMLTGRSAQLIGRATFEVVAR